MLVDHLLFAVRHQHNHKVVIPCDGTPELEAIHQKQCHRNLVLTGFLQNSFL